MSILSFVRLGNGYASSRLSCVKASMYRPRHTYYITGLVFVCPYVRTTLAIHYGMTPLKKRLLIHEKKFEVLDKDTSVLVGYT